MFPFLIDRTSKLIARINSEEVTPCDLFFGMRTIAQQDALYALGRTVKNQDGACSLKPLGNIVTNARGGYSFHNYGLAADIVFRPGGRWSWDYKKYPYARLGEVGQSLGMTWGGSPEFTKKLGQPDPAHFQITGGISINRARSLFEKGGLEAIWSVVLKIVDTSGGY